MAEIEFEEKRLHALCQQKDRRIEALEAELAGVTKLLREGSKALGILNIEQARPSKDAVTDVEIMAAIQVYEGRPEDTSMYEAMKGILEVFTSKRKSHE